MIYTADRMQKAMQDPGRIADASMREGWRGDGNSSEAKGEYSLHHGWLLMCMAGQVYRSRRADATSATKNATITRSAPNILTSLTGCLARGG
jgi:hypothetical protein